MKIRGSFIVPVLVALLFCSVLPQNVSSSETGKRLSPLKIAVFSDAHLYSTTLGTTGSAFLASLDSDRKLLIESESILQAMIKMVNAEKPDILIIPGDLTKDGEMINHQLMANYLREIKNNGTKVFVIPGNHDINNPHACRYNGDSAIAIDRVQPADFRRIYADFGYGDAIYTDTASLSYVTEPAPGLWLIGMDACRYAENVTFPITSGKFSDATLSWIIARLQEVRAKQKFVLGFLHHSILEHYTGEEQLFPEYIVDNYQNISKQFSDNGMQVVFTGHYHAQDITLSDFGSGTDFYDIETGSLVTYPCPVRFMTLSTQYALAITSQFVQQISFDTGTKTFPEYAHDYLLSGMQTIAYNLLVGPKASGGFGFSDSVAAMLAPEFALAFSAHYSGDEKPDTQTVSTIQSYLNSPNPDLVQMGQYLKAFWTDLPPQDNTLTIQLNPVTGISRDDRSNAGEYALLNNYPNPFNPSTVITYELPGTVQVTLTIYDMLGNEVSKPVDGLQGAGRHEVTFSGKGMASGLYLYRLQAGNYASVRKMLLVK